MTKYMCGLVALGIILAASQSASAAGSQQGFCAKALSAGKLALKIQSCGQGTDAGAQNSGGDNTTPGNAAGANPGGNPNNGGGGGGGGFNGPKDKNGPNQG